MAATRWEYKRVTRTDYSGTYHDPTVSLALSREYGEAGWELVVVVFDPKQEEFVYFFKRPLE